MLGAELDDARVTLDEAIARWERAVETVESSEPAT
jgi:exonuclease VII small subunit